MIPLCGWWSVTMMVIEAAEGGVGIQCSPCTTIRHNQVDEPPGARRVRSMGTHNDTVAPPEREDVARRYRELLSTYKTINAEVAELAWSLADLEQEIATLAASTVAAGARLRQRLRDLRQQRDALEEQALRRMDQAEAIAAELARLRQTLGNVETPVAVRSE